MKFVFIFLLTFASLNSIFSNGWDEDYVNLIMSKASDLNENISNEARNSESFARNKFFCNSFASTSARPTSVHALKPNDIEVIGAIGDSLTAANGAKAATIIGLLEECRGVSWSMGGEKSDINQLITLPNILRQFNPNLYGFSLGSGTWSSSNANFNQAKPGETSFEMMEQAKNMVDRMRRSDKIDFVRGWKLVTFFVGGNDLCKSCTNAKYTAQNIINNIRATLDYLQSNLPRTLVNMVLTLDVSGIEDLTGSTCRNMQKTFCDCGLSATYRNTLLGLTKSIQNGVEDLVNSGLYDKNNEFTVVVQPFMKNMKPPRKTDGNVDYSYFAPDCFHLSSKGHQAAAVELWNSMLTPVGRKQTSWTNLNQNIACPSQNAPYIFTNVNSKIGLRSLLPN